jgi:6-pyruvoyltetrahydropterin/6-carboxytetrahydropterin synthase
MEATVTRLAHFNAAHRLHNPQWTDDRNREVFGKCNNPEFHGHNYELEVSVTGTIDPETGYVMDVKLLADLIKAEVEQRFDHKNLNTQTQEFANLNPTAENIAVVIFQLLQPRLNPGLKLKVKLYETPRNFVEYSGL